MPLRSQFQRGRRYSRIESMLKRLRKKGLELILWGSLAATVISGCGDDMDLWGRTVISDKTYTFSEDVKRSNELEVVPLDSTWGIVYFDGDNDHRILSPYDRVILFYPKENWRIEYIEYPDSRLYTYDSSYVFHETVLKDTLDMRRKERDMKGPQPF